MKSESGFSLAIASLPLWIKMDLSLWIKIDWLFPHTGRRLGNVTEVQLRWRTLAGFSTAAEQKMSGQVIHLKIWQIILMNLNILQMMFELFNDYYGLPDYADEVLDIIPDSHFTNFSSS